ncbi:SMP-30/gluconolactonase/LRE family protein [Falsiroseomonas sp. CW058]|uniref:SMP-30/gluconolactonase/LRE family protein n=1 Tax=Falsiroseomonas sp. CW058 TaxID=3388664 RepID=UPI003D319F59
MRTETGLDGLAFAGHDLHRPECVLATRRGDLYVSDRRGGVTHIAPDGSQRLIGGGTLIPNGIALLRDGSFAIANLSDEGGVWRLRPDGTLSREVTEIAGRRLGSVNFVRTDSRGRLWICVSTGAPGDSYTTHVEDGFVALRDERGIRVLATGLGWTNECWPDEARGHLYVNETFGRRLTRFDMTPDGTLSNRVTLSQFGAGDFPDGLALDEAGGVWVVSVASNRVWRVAPDGTRALVVEDSAPERLDLLEEALSARRLSRDMMHGTRGRVLRNASSIAFGGADRRTAHLGSLGGTRLATFRAPVAGVAPVHWDW